MKRAEDIRVVIQAVMQFFEGNTVKVDLWMSTPNPGLGMHSPLDMIDLRRTHKLRAFVETALEENKR